jgi:hypothetical protein
MQGSPRPLRPISNRLGWIIRRMNEEWERQTEANKIKLAPPDNTVKVVCARQREEVECRMQNA